MRKLSHGHLQVHESVLTNLQSIEEIDIFVFIEGGEPRSTYALEHIEIERVKKAFRIRFAEPISAADYSREATDRIRRLEERGVLVNVDCNKSTDVFENVHHILQKFEDVVSDTKCRRLCVDISTMPKAYFLSILGWALNSVGLPKITFVYSPGKYEKDGKFTQYFPGTFTEGAWHLKQVAYLEGPTSTRDDRALFSFVGADINKAEEIFRRFEPLPKALLYPDGFDDSLGERERVHNDLSKFFGVPLDSITFCARDSAIDALVALRKAHKKAYDAYGNGGLLFPFATKLSALAAGIFAAFDTTISMYVRVPEKYVPMKVHPDGKIVVVTILDVTNRLASAYLS